jgi:hypothetical protein
MDGLLIVELIFGFFAFVLIVGGTVILVLWNRRKLIWTNFLSKTGHWERKGWYPDKLDANFNYDDEPYEYNVEDCTRDWINRPIAHYMKGNPIQLKFDVQRKDKPIIIRGEELTPKDFITLMKSKVLRDIFTDDEVVNLLYIILGAVVIIGIIGVIISATHNPKVALDIGNNDTAMFIARSCKMALTNKVI